MTWARRFFGGWLEINLGVLDKGGDIEHPVTAWCAVVGDDAGVCILSEGVWVETCCLNRLPKWNEVGHERRLAKINKIINNYFITSAPRVES